MEGFEYDGIGIQPMVLISESEDARTKALELIGEGSTEASLKISHKVKPDAVTPKLNWMPLGYWREVD